MADEITLSVALDFDKSPATPVQQEYGSAIVDATGPSVSGILTVAGTSSAATVIPLGPVTTVGWFIGKNLDETITITLQNGSSATPFAEVPPGGCFLFKLGSSIVPYASRASGSPKLEYTIIGA